MRVGAAKRSSRPVPSACAGNCSTDYSVALPSTYSRIALVAANRGRSSDGPNPTRYSTATGASSKKSNIKTATTRTVPTAQNPANSRGLNQLPFASGSLMSGTLTVARACGVRPTKWVRPIPLSRIDGLVEDRGFGTFNGHRHRAGVVREDARCPPRNIPNHAHSVRLRERLPEVRVSPPSARTVDRQRSEERRVGKE